MRVWTCFFNQSSRGAGSENSRSTLLLKWIWVQKKEKSGILPIVWTRQWISCIYPPDNRVGNLCRTCPQILTGRRELSPNFLIIYEVRRILKSGVSWPKKKRQKIWKDRKNHRQEEINEVKAQACKIASLG